MPNISINTTYPITQAPRTHTSTLPLCHPSSQILPLNALPLKRTSRTKRQCRNSNAHNKHIPYRFVIGGKDKWKLCCVDDCSDTGCAGVDYDVWVDVRETLGYL